MQFDIFSAGSLKTAAYYGNTLYMLNLFLKSCQAISAHGFLVSGPKPTKLRQKWLSQPKE